MTDRKKEPDRLRRGKDFHRKVQTDWLTMADGKVTVERPLGKPSGRQGRADVFATTEGQNREVAIAEVKASDWDAMTFPAVRRNVRRQARQVWAYVQSQLDLGQDVCPGIVFPHKPQDRERMNLIECLFEEEGISIVWDDEPIEERRKRG